MKTYLRNILMNPEITGLTGDNKVYFLKATSAVAPYVVYAFIDEWGAEFAENKEQATSYSIQVDIFSKGDYTALEEKILEIMTANDFHRTSGFDFYEPDTGLYHKVFRFNYTKMEE